MEQARYPRSDYGRDYRRERRREHRQKRSSSLQRRYNFRGVKGAVVAVLLLVGIGYISYLGVTYLYDFFSFLLRIRATS